MAMLGLQRFTTSDGVVLRYRKEGAGPLVVALHGFPDTYRTWDAMASGLVQAGFCVTALAMRGYAPSDIPLDRNYSVDRLATDVVDLLDHLGVQSATVLGHDWGASAAYALAALYPERMTSIVTLAIPPLALGSSGLVERWVRPHNIYLGLGGVSDWWLRRKNFREVDRLYRLWSPNWSVSDRHMETVYAALQPAERSRAAVDYYTLGKTGQSAVRLAVPISVPALVIYGGDEPDIRKAAFRNSLAVTGRGSKLVRIQDVGHWPHLEAPERCLSETKRFLTSMISAVPESADSSL